MNRACIGLGGGILATFVTRLLVDREKVALFFQANAVGAAVLHVVVGQKAANLSPSAMNFPVSFMLPT